MTDRGMLEKGTRNIQARWLWRARSLRYRLSLADRKLFVQGVKDDAKRTLDIERGWLFGRAAGEPAPPPPKPRLTGVPTEPGYYYTDAGIIHVEFRPEKGGICQFYEDTGGPGSWSAWFRVDDPDQPSWLRRRWGKKVPDET